MHITSAKLLRARVLGTVCALGIALSPASAAAEESIGKLAEQAGVGLGAIVGTFFYAPVKGLYAGGGLIIGGLAYAFSAGDKTVMRKVIAPAVGGDYVLTTDHLWGRKPVEFIGGRSAGGAASKQVAAAPPK